MTLELEWNSVSHGDWARLLDTAARSPFEQSWAYGAAVAETGGTVTRALLRRDGAPWAAAQFLGKRFGPLSLRQLLRGPVFLAGSPDADAVETALRLLQKGLTARGRALRFWTPELGGDAVDFRALGWRRVMTGHNTVWLDLGADEDALRRGLDGNWRNGLVKAEKQDLHIHASGNADALETAIAAYENLRRDRSFGGPSPDLLRAAATMQTGRDSFLVMTAAAARDPVAVALFARHGNTATYAAGWSDDTGRRTNAATLLLWRGLLELKRNGAAWLDLGGFDTRSAPGIARFKLGLGGEIVTLAGTFF